MGQGMGMSVALVTQLGLIMRERAQAAGQCSAAPASAVELPEGTPLGIGHASDVQHGAAAGVGMGLLQLA
jgi:hypothetical protein